VSGDTAWSVPGETAGIRERYQSRHLGGLFLQAGSNAMERRGSNFVFVVPESKTPWNVLANLPDPDVYNWLRLKTVAQGVAGSQAKARGAAEKAARAFLSNQEVAVAS